MKLIMEIGEQSWQGKDVYEFIVRECHTVFEVGFSINADLDPELLSDFLKDAQLFGVKLTAFEQKFIQTENQSNDKKTEKSVQ